MSKWAQTTQALKNKAGGLEGTLDRKVHNASEKFSGLLKEGDEAHRVSKYNWKRAMFKFRATLHHGIPGGPTCIAYDPIQHLMAIGTDKGLVKVFGKPGVEVVVNQYEGSISHLCFANNRGKLVIVHKGGSCAGVNLDSRRSIGSYVFKGTDVTCLVHVPNTEFIIVGLSSGNVHVLSTENKLAVSSYRISGRSSLLVPKSSSIASLAFHPTQSNVLLIAHDCGTINEWDMIQEKGIQSYKQPEGNFGTLNAIDWHPDGIFFISGHRSGDVLLWKRGAEKFSSVIHLSAHPNTPRRPIRKLFYTSLHGKPFICAFGGTSMSHEADSGTILYNQHLTVLPPKITSEITHSKAVKGVAIDMALALPTSYPFSCDPCSVVFITTTSDITVFAPAGGRFQHIRPSPNFKLQLSRVTCTLFSSVSQGFLNDLLTFGDIVWEPRNWPVLGGSSSIQPHTSTDVLVTGHSDGMVYFWDMSNTLFNLLYAINILTDVTVESSAVLSIDLCAESRILALSCASGETLVYNFNKQSSALSKIQISLIQQEQERNEQNENRFVNSEANSPKHDDPLPVRSKIVSSTPPPSASKPSSVPTERKSKAKTSSTATNTSVFSWERFFLNAKVDKGSAAKYAAFFEGEKITEDLVKDLDQDMMEMAGITAVGDKMRITKYVKSSYSRSDCLSDSNIDSGALGSSKKKSKRKSKKKRTKRVSEPEAIVFEEPEPEPEPIIVHQEPEPVIQPKKLKVPTTKPPGYQLNAQCSFHNRITQIRIASSLSKIAVGDNQGNVALLDITTGSVLLHKALAETQQSPVTWLCFDDRAIVQKEVASRGKRILKAQKSKKQTSVEPGLFVGLEDGRIFYVALRTGQLDSIAIPGSDHSSTLSSILLLDGTGAPVVPVGVAWETIQQEQNDSVPSYDDEDDVEVELVIKNLDEECNRSVPAASESPHTEASGVLRLEDSKFLLVCSGNMILIYALPSYRIYATFECEEKPESANVVERDGGNYCLIVFMASGDLKILTLMDLLEIKTIPQALQNIGVQIEARRLKHDINCTTDGRFVVLTKYQEVIRGSLFADENLLGLPYSLPRLHVPGVPEPDDEQQKAEQVFQTSEYQRLFGNVKVQAVEKERHVPVRSVAGTNEKDVDRQRKQLIGDAKPIKRVTPSNQKLSVSEKVARSVGSSVADVKDIMVQNMDALAVRREKLEDLLVSTDAVASKANTFADVAEQMAEKEKNRKWWQ